VLHISCSLSSAGQNDRSSVLKARKSDGFLAYSISNDSIPSDGRKRCRRLFFIRSHGQSQRGIASFSSGLRGTSYPGKGGTNLSNPARVGSVAGGSIQPFQGWDLFGALGMRPLQNAYKEQVAVALCYPLHLPAGNAVGRDRRARRFGHRKSIDFTPMFEPNVARRALAVAPHLCFLSVFSRSRILAPASWTAAVLRRFERPPISRRSNEPALFSGI
jgi:hypothetical protein